MDTSASAQQSLPLTPGYLLFPPGIQPRSQRPAIVGILGLPGSGKTFLWNQMWDQLGEEHYKFFEGSQAIAGVCPVRTELPYLPPCRTSDISHSIWSVP